MMLSLLVASVLSGQFVESASVSGGGCPSPFNGADVLVASSTVQIFRNDEQQRPKQGETFFIVINVRGEEGIGTCGSVISVRPGFELPEGFELVTPTGALGDSPLSCFLGTPPNLTPQIGSCPTAPTDTAADGALLFDRLTFNGLWPLREGQVLQIVVPVRARNESDFANQPRLRGHLEYTPFDGSNRAPLHPSVAGFVFFNRPTITYDAPSTQEIGSYDAHFFGFVDNHFNPGTLLVELKVGAGAFEVFDSVALTADTFENNIDLVVEPLDADTDHQWRFTFDPVRANTNSIVGATQSFRTLPAPRFAYTPTVTGAGSITTDPAAEADGTFIDRTDVTLTAVPDAGQRLISFVVNGADVAGDSITVHVEAALTARATFEAIPPPPPPPPDGEGEGEGAQGEGEGDGVPVEGEGEGAQSEGEGEGVEGEGDRNASDDDEDDGDDEGVVDGCVAGAPGSALVLLLLLRRRRR